MVEDSQLSIGKLDIFGQQQSAFHPLFLWHTDRTDRTGPAFCIILSVDGTDQRLDFPVEVQDGVTWNWPQIFWLAALKWCARCHRFYTISNKAGRWNDLCQWITSIPSLWREYGLLNIFHDHSKLGRLSHLGARSWVRSSFTQKESMV